ncbi:MAG: transglutaminase-like putative cysteine protease, partial [Planctomycetaceae bacterium]
MKYRIVHSTAYQYSDPVPVCHNHLRLAPRETLYTRCTSHRMLIRPVPEKVARRKDWFGNIVQSFTLDESHRKLLLTATSRVTVTPQAVPPSDQTAKWEDIAAGVRAQSLDGWFEVTEFVFDSSLASREETFREYAADCFPVGQPILAGAIALMSKI